MSTVFISHAATDREFARRLAQSVVRNGYQVTSDEVPVTADWGSVIRQAIAKAARVLVVLSENSANNANVMFELGMAAALKKPIVLFDTSGAAPHVLASNWTMNNVVVVDARKDFENAVRKSLAA